MIMGFGESKEVGGRFYEFKYKTVVKRNERSEHFGCFKGNDLETFELEESIFCTSEEHFIHTLGTWRDTFGIYSFIPVGQVNPKISYRATDVVDIIYSRNNYKYIPFYHDLYGYIK